MVLDPQHDERVIDAPGLVDRWSDVTDHRARAALAYGLARRGRVPREAVPAKMMADVAEGTIWEPFDAREKADAFIGVEQPAATNCRGSTRIV